MAGGERGVGARKLNPLPPLGGRAQGEGGALTLATLRACATGFQSFDRRVLHSFALHPHPNPLPPKGGRGSAGALPDGIERLVLDAI